MQNYLTPDFLLGNWTYRSWLNSDDLTVPLTTLEFGYGYIQIESAPFNEFKGKIFGPKSDKRPNPYDKPYSWELDLKGSSNYGDPFSFRFQGKGVVSGSEWIYDYQGYMIKPWPNGVNQVPALVGTIVRTIPHPDGSGGTAPAGVVASWYAVCYTE
ncbi:MAG: hypothetical protein H6581_25090 [Bacteroidia bacterium]|nr:hypothetical protein [Bacteroidia bacterium]